jgi:UDP-glucose 4-epimerase
MQYNPKILIIGRNSFIGNSFAEYSDFKQCDKISLRTANLKDLDFSGYDVVLHLPAIVHQSSKIPYQRYYEVNAELAYQTALKAKKEGVKQFIFFSTIRIYGEYTPKNLIWDEFTEPVPTDNYGRSKLEAEKKLKSLNDLSFRIAILRIPMVYGPGNRGNINRMIDFMVNYRFAPFLNINNERNILYIKNLTQYLEQVIFKKAHGTFLASDPEAVSTTKIARAIAMNMNQKIYMFSIPKLVRKILKIVWRSGYHKIFGNLKLDGSKSFKILNYTPEYSLEEGMEEMIEWYLTKESN